MGRGGFTIGEVGIIVATNRPIDEDDSARIKDTDLSKLLAGTDYTLFENASDSDGSSTRQIWQYLLVAALLFLIIEAVLCLAKKPTKRKRVLDKKQANDNNDSPYATPESQPSP